MSFQSSCQKTSQHRLGFFYSLTRLPHPLVEAEVFKNLIKYYDVISLYLVMWRSDVLVTSRVCDECLVVFDHVETV